MNIGNIIRNHRKKLNMTQKELAETLNVSHITVCRWETNVIVPTPLNWKIIQNFFGIKNNDPETVQYLELLKTLSTGSANNLKTKISHKKPYNRNEEIVENYNKGISIDNLSKFYNFKEETIKKILRSEKVKIIPRKSICILCDKEFHGKSRTCSKKCKRKLDSLKQKPKSPIIKKVYVYYCENCKEKFTSNSPNRKHCSKKCSKEYYANSKPKLIINDIDDLEIENQENQEVRLTGVYK